MSFYKYAGFWRRLVAFSIDSTITIFIFSILFTIASLSFFFGAISGNSRDMLAGLTDPTGFYPIMIFSYVFFIFTNLAYFTYFHGATGQTPGKMLLGLQVVSVDGARISFGVAFLRASAYFISFIIYLLGFIWVAFDKKKQGWHDKIAGTVVIIREQQNNAAGISIPDSPTIPEAQQIRQDEEFKAQNDQADKMPENKE